ncbi:MAG: nucleotidyltransferase domain-containing protein [Methanobacteriaceae archaeon]|nr:nucleotidyltransferase domain-containing protein [Methanobacteriaceae archaeon]
MNNRFSIAKEFANRIKSEYIKQIILFGSVARGEDTEFSDIDILIISSYGNKLEPIIEEEVFQVMMEKEE